MDKVHRDVLQRPQSIVIYVANLSCAVLDLSQIAVNISKHSAIFVLDACQCAAVKMVYKLSF